MRSVLRFIFVLPVADRHAPHGLVASFRHAPRLAHVPE
jgi:hypothetical protein